MVCFGGNRSLMFIFPFGTVLTQKSQEYIHIILPIIHLLYCVFLLFIFYIVSSYFHVAPNSMLNLHGFFIFLYLYPM